MRNSPLGPRPSILSVTADYALRALLVLAGNADGPMPADTIARRLGAPRNYLAKTMHSLAKAGVVVSTRGPLGGFALARPADRITVADIAAVFDGPPPANRCLLSERPCNPSDPCLAHDRWAVVSFAAHQALATTTVAQLCDGQPFAALGNAELTKATLHETLP